jgi:hypothetical protein
LSFSSTLAVAVEVVVAVEHLERLLGRWCISTAKPQNRDTLRRRTTVAEGVLTAG